MKGKFVPTTVYYTYNKWKSCYKEILKIFLCKKQYIEFLKQYLYMEEWFHDSNNKIKVINAQPLTEKVL